MKEAQKQMERIQQQMNELVVEASSGGGMVTVTMNGARQLLSIKIDPGAVNSEEVQMLQDLILAAVSEANRKIDEAMANQLGPLAQGFKIPGLF